MFVFGKKKKQREVHDYSAIPFRFVLLGLK